MRKSGFGGLAHFCFFKKGEWNEYRKSVFGDGAHRNAHAEVRRSLHHLPVGGGALQHCGPDLHCQCSYLGSYGNAANTVVFPLTVVALAFAVMVGDGCCAFVSMALGRNELGKAKRSVGNAVVLIVAGSLVLTAVYLIFADGIIAMFGGTVNEETFHHSQEYFFYITLGIPFYMFGQAMNPIIRADGNPKFAMISTLAGAVLNIILDPIFIFAFKWGMMGAAVATVIG